MHKVVMTNASGDAANSSKNAKFSIGLACYLFEYDIDS
jgi:hypothetical protein